MNKTLPFKVDKKSFYIIGAPKVLSICNTSTKVNLSVFLYRFLYFSSN